MLVLSAGGAACGGEEEESGTTSQAATSSTSREGSTAPEPRASDAERGEGRAHKPRQPRPNDESEGGAPEPRIEADRPNRPEPDFDAEQRQAQRVASDYLRAIDERDGEAICDRLAADALAELELPKPRGDCAGSLEASIGYADPRGLPVYESSRINGFVATTVTGDVAQVVVAVQTEFADRDLPSIEDDIVYLSRERGGWEIAKASSSLYRAVGIADIPPSVISPP